MHVSQDLLDRAAALLSDRRPIYEQMRAAERERGFQVVIPGEVEWLPAEDWHESNVVSRDDDEVRLIAILAKRPGSFRRLLSRLALHRLRPVVVCPIGPIMPAILQHYGWIKREIGSGWDMEEQWRPDPEKPRKRRVYTRADLAHEDFQPRFALWLRITPGGTFGDYMEWISRNVVRYHAARGITHTSDQNDFSAWLEANAAEDERPAQASSEKD